ncbi:MAG: hypothetical protein HY720_13715 [Planctomycetes bacterium]|nr:hypothetical protein [Planctomycetota bacterium]
MGWTNDRGDHAHDSWIQIGTDCSRTRIYGTWDGFEIRNGRMTGGVATWGHVNNGLYYRVRAQMEPGCFPCITVTYDVFDRCGRHLYSGRGVFNQVG